MPPPPAKKNLAKQKQCQTDAVYIFTPSVDLSVEPVAAESYWGGGGAGRQIRWCD